MKFTSKIFLRMVIINKYTSDWNSIDANRTRYLFYFLLVKFVLFLKILLVFLQISNTCAKQHIHTSSVYASFLRPNLNGL